VWLAALLALAMLVQASSTGLAQDATPTENPQAATTGPESTGETPPTSIPEPSTEPTATEDITPVPSEIPTEPTAGTETPPTGPEASSTATMSPTEEPGNESASILAVEPILVSPETPVVVQSACVRGVISQPTVTFATTTGLSYQSSDTPVAGGDYSLIASLDTGYAWGPMPDGWDLVNGAVAFASFDLDDAPPCSDVVPSSPTVHQATCTGGTFAPPSLVLPANTSVIGYTLVGQPAVGRSVVVTAELLRDSDSWATPLPAGWIDEGSIAVISTGIFAKAACAPAIPIVVAATCINGVARPASVTVPPDTNAISYELQTSSSVDVVIAFLRTGTVSWANPLPTGWIVVDTTAALFEVDDLDANPCASTNLAAPEVFHAMFIDTYEPGDVIDLTPIVPGSPGIAYRVTGTVAPNGTITVTADLHDGYDWPDDLPHGWNEIDEDTAVHSFTIDADFEIVVNPAAPTIKQATCKGDAPVVSLPGTTGVTYGKSGNETAGGRVIVSATLDGGYDWSGTLPSGWKLADDASASYVVDLDKLACSEGGGASDPVHLGASANDDTPTVTALPSTGSGPIDTTNAVWGMILAVISVAAGLGFRRART
jgi:hypothetical protein